MTVLEARTRWIIIVHWYPMLRTMSRSAEKSTKLCKSSTW